MTGPLKKISQAVKRVQQGLPLTSAAFTAAAVRERFEKRMTSPGDLVTGRVGRFLAPRLQERMRKYRRTLGEGDAWAAAANHCSELMIAVKDDVLADIKSQLGARSETSDGGLRSRISQAAVSNSGKIFERFTAYACSKALFGTNWAIWKDNADIEQIIGISKTDLLGITKRILGEDISIHLESDYIAFKPEEAEHTPIVLLNCKTSMKERVHQATMWAILLQLVRNPRLRKEFGLKTSAASAFSRCRYCLVTGDFAEEQPDLRGKPRKLLLFDMSFFDASFAAIPEKWNPDMPGTFKADSTSPIYRLSALRSYLENLDATAPRI